MDLATVFGAFLVLLGAAGIFLAAVLVRRSLGLEDTLRARIEDTAQALRVEAKAVYEQAEALLDDARAIRNREYGRKGGRPPKQAPEDPNGQVNWDRETYIAHVTRTGRAIPEVEAKLGL
jgi:hypothetical protein